MSEPLPTCGSCGRERTLSDAYDYNPLQVVTGQPLGWYSDDDGELPFLAEEQAAERDVCPACGGTGRRS